MFKVPAVFALSVLFGFSAFAQSIEYRCEDGIASDGTTIDLALHVDPSSREITVGNVPGLSIYSYKRGVPDPRVKRPAFIQKNFLAFRNVEQKSGWDDRYLAIKIKRKPVVRDEFYVSDALFAGKPSGYMLNVVYTAGDADHSVFTIPCKKVNGGY